MPGDPMAAADHFHPGINGNMNYLGMMDCGGRSVALPYKPR